MASYISSIKKQLTEDNSDEEPKGTEDSFLKRDLEKLKSMWRNVKEVYFSSKSNFPAQRRLGDSLIIRRNEYKSPV
jgi:hypothetical protein